MLIDHVESLKLDDAQVARYGNELRSLAYLAQGLEFLYRQVDQMEASVREALPADKVFVLYGNAPVLRDVPQGLVASAFHWYAVSACNYVRMVGWLASGEDVKGATSYVKRVIPQVYIWRNKVGAHFARIAPHPKDTLADLAASVMFPTGFKDDAFWTAPLVLALRKGGRTSTSRKDMRWSLTHVHRELSSRYWPATPASASSKADAGVTLVVPPRGLAQIHTSSRVKK